MLCRHVGYVTVQMRMKLAARNCFCVAPQSGAYLMGEECHRMGT